MFSATDAIQLPTNVEGGKPVGRNDGQRGGDGQRGVGEVEAAKRRAGRRGQDTGSMCPSWAPLKQPAVRLHPRCSGHDDNRRQDDGGTVQDRPLAPVYPLSRLNSGVADGTRIATRRITVATRVNGEADKTPRRGKLGARGLSGGVRRAGGMWSVAPRSGGLARASTRLSTHPACRLRASPKRQPAGLLSKSGRNASEMPSAGRARFCPGPGAVDGRRGLVLT
jgi:hypothetical protein